MVIVRMKDRILACICFIVSLSVLQNNHIDTNMPTVYLFQSKLSIEIFRFFHTFLLMRFEIQKNSNSFEVLWIFYPKKENVYNSFKNDSTSKIFPPFKPNLAFFTGGNIDVQFGRCYLYDREPNKRISDNCIVFALPVKLYIFKK
jgi:hypothetical protein